MVLLSIYWSDSMKSWPFIAIFIIVMIINSDWPLKESAQAGKRVQLN